MFKLIVLTCVLVVVAADKYAQTEEQRTDIKEDGQYQYNYRTSNEISAQEAGVGGVLAQGSAQWYAPDGVGVQFSYLADQNGYVASGTHIPIPPAIPAYILKAAEWAKAHPYKDEWTKPEDLVWQPDA